MPDARPDRKQLLAFARNYIPGITEKSCLEELAGGSLNFVWRIRSKTGKTYIIKHAPPYIAAVPNIAFDDSRILFEAKILKAFHCGNELGQLLGFGVRPPVFLGLDASKHLLLMEDVGEWPDLLKAARLSDDNLASYGSKLGAFIAQLHIQTFQSNWFGENFANLPVQQTRLQVQYRGCLDFCLRADMPEAEEIGRWCRQLGEKLNSLGKCLVMGDLWPGSILLSREDIRLIDWELTHFGRPAQDVAHLSAHLWMMSHRAENQSQRDRISSLSHAFITGYSDRTARYKPELITEEDQRDYQIHFGAEILARTLGSFQKDYLYDGLSPNDPIIREAAEEARKWLSGERQLTDRLT
ncbi:MAG: phosphotransferase [bacterium]|nr:phosphotransferase [bacterium]